MALRGILSQCALLTDCYGLNKNDLDGLVLAWASEVKGYTIKEVESAFYIYRQPKEAGGEGGKKFPPSATIKEILLREKSKNLLKLESPDSIKNSRVRRCQRIVNRVVTLGFSIEEDEVNFLVEFKQELGSLIPPLLQDKVDAYLGHKNRSEEERAAQRLRFAEELENVRRVSEEEVN